MARLCTFVLVFISLWVYNWKSGSIFQGVNSVLITQAGEKCNLLDKLDNRNNGTTADGRICDSSGFLECSLESERCQCKKGYTISKGKKCLEIARNGLESKCEESIQCWKSLMGRLSECYEGKCRCYESETIPIVFHQNRCYYGEGLGDFCQIEGLCKSSTKNAECSEGICKCEKGFIPNWDKSGCLKIAQTINSSCVENVQCENSELGPLSECYEKKCQCFKTPMVATVFHTGRCYVGAALSDICHVSAQCLSTTENSHCGRDGKCHCEERFVSSTNNTICIPATYKDEIQEDCQNDIQCTTNLGHTARCNIVKKKCECIYQEEDGYGDTDIEISGEKTTMVIVGKKCYSVKSIGDSCKFNLQCQAKTKNSVCSNGICECIKDFHILNVDRTQCLPLSENNFDSFECEEDGQCFGSKCNKTKKKCLHLHLQSADTTTNSFIGDACEFDKDCHLLQNTQCIKEKCQCKNGFVALDSHVCLISSSASSSTSSSSSSSASQLKQFSNFNISLYFFILFFIIILNY